MKNTTLKPSSNLRTIDVINNGDSFVETVSVNTIALDSFFPTPPGLIKVILTEQGGVISDRINYRGKTYLTNIIAGSGLKADVPFIYAVENASNTELLKLLNFKESISYSQRALLPSSEQSIGGQLRVMSFGEADPKRKFVLKNGVNLSVYDGWGFIKKSAAMVIGDTYSNKRVPRNGAGSMNYQQLMWYDGHTPELINELSKGSASKITDLLSTSEPLTENGTIIRKVHNLFSAGDVHTEMVVAMPSSDEQFTLPSDQRFSVTEGKDIAIFRNPADKFNFQPVGKENLSYNNGTKSSFINSMEAIQYSLTGKLNGNSVFFKGMLGIIDDDLFPDEFNDYDIVNNAVDRKLSSDWTTIQDRDSTQSQSVSSVIDGHLMVTQWYAEGNLASIPTSYMTYLSGDYDGDEISIVFEHENPELLKYIKRGYIENPGTLNPKIEKPFTPRQSFSGMEHIQAYRSNLIGTASNTAGVIFSMPKPKLELLVKKLNRVDPGASPVSNDVLILNLKSEIQSLIKEGTDIFKTQKNPRAFEERLRTINEITTWFAGHDAYHVKFRRILYNGLNYIFKGKRDSISRMPKLSEAFWRNLYFSYNERDIRGQYITEGVPARIFGKVLDDLLSPTDRQNIDSYRTSWKATDGSRYYLPTAQNPEIQKLIPFVNTQDITINEISKMIALSDIDGISVKIAPQALLVGDNSTGICDSLSDAWLFALSREDNGKMKNVLLDNIYTQSRVLASKDFENENNSNPNLLKDIEQFITTLQNLNEPTERPALSLRKITEQLFNYEGVYFSLHTGNHAIGVARTADKFYFYDPNLVEISFSVSSVKTENQLYKLFSSYFDVSASSVTLNTYYDLPTIDGELTFKVANFTSSEKASKPAFITLTQYLSNKTTAGTSDIPLDPEFEEIRRIPRSSGLTLTSSTKRNYDFEVFNYEKQLILELQGDMATFETAKSIYDKHQEQSEWAPLSDDGEIRFYNKQDIISSFGIPVDGLNFDKKGFLRITLIGQSSTDSNGLELFGSKSAESLKTFLDQLLNRLPKNKIEGIDLKLVGYRVTDNPVIDNILPGKLASWLMEKADIMSISRSNIAVKARQYEVRVSPSGKKEINVPESGWVNNEIAISKDILNKYDIQWDKNTSKLINQKTSATELFVQKAELNAYKARLSANDPLLSETNTTISALDTKINQSISNTIGLSAKERTNAEQLATDNLKLIDDANNWEKAINALKSSHNLSADWVPLIHEENNANANYVKFINKITKATRDIPTTNDDIRNFSAKNKALFDTFKLGFEKDTATNIYKPKTNVSDTEGINSMNAAFMIMSLMTYEKDAGDIPGQSTTFNDAMKVQYYSSLIQNVVSIADDVVKLADMFTVISNTPSLLSKINIASTVGSGVGIVLNVMMITATGIALSETHDIRLKTALITQIAITSFQTAFNAAGILAGVLGASAVSSIIGFIAVPLAGIATGIPSLVAGYEALRVGFDNAAEKMNELYKVVESKNFDAEIGLLSFKNGTIDSINFKVNAGKATVQYSTMTISGTKGGAGHTVTDGWDHYSAKPDPDYDANLDIYEGFGLSKNQQYDAKPIKSILLPTGYKSNYKTYFQQVTGKRGAYVPAYNALRAYYGTRFVWGCYAVPTDFAIYKMDEIKQGTPVTITLDDTSRAIIIPPLLSGFEERQNALNEINNLMSYRINGDGGVYNLVLSPKAMNITITPKSDSDSETWLIDIDSAIKPYNFKVIDADKKIDQLQLQTNNWFGFNLKESRYNPFGNIKLVNNSLVINGQSFVKFSKLPASLIVKTTIDSVNGLYQCFSLTATPEGNTLKEPFMLQSSQFTPQVINDSVLIAGRNFLNKMTNIVTKPYMPIVADNAKGGYYPNKDTVILLNKNVLHIVKRTMDRGSYSASTKKLPANASLDFQKDGRINILGNIAISGQNCELLVTFNSDHEILYLTHVKISGTAINSFLNLTLQKNNIYDFIVWLKENDAANALSDITITNELQFIVSKSNTEAIVYSFNTLGKLEIKNGTWGSITGGDTYYVMSPNTLSLFKRQSNTEANISSPSPQYLDYISTDRLLMLYWGDDAVLSIIVQYVPFRKIFIPKIPNTSVQNTLMLPFRSADMTWKNDGNDLILINTQTENIIRIADAFSVPTENFAVQFTNDPVKYTVTQLKTLLTNSSLSLRLTNSRYIGENYYFDNQLKEVLNYDIPNRPSIVPFKIEQIQDAYIKYGYLHLVGLSSLIYRMEQEQLFVIGKQNSTTVEIYPQRIKVNIDYKTPETLKGVVVIDNIVHVIGKSDLLYRFDSSSCKLVGKYISATSYKKLVSTVAGNNSNYFIEVDYTSDVKVSADGTIYLLEGHDSSRRIRIITDVNSTQIAANVVGIENVPDWMSFKANGELELTPKNSAYGARYILKNGKLYLIEFTSYNTITADALKVEIQKNVIGIYSGTIDFYPTGVIISLSNNEKKKLIVQNGVASLQNI